jgi:peptidoglycan/xylan/chitin deacetylase (PgdA/CDA1 family)
VTAAVRGAGIDSPIERSDALDPTYYQHERYLGRPERSHLLSAYYTAKPVIPRSVQLRLRRRYASRQASRRFPSWPIEPILIERQHADLRRALLEADTDRLPLVCFWPNRHSSACVLTHDVEGARGIERIDRVLEIERRHGFVSSWNFVAEDYEIPPRTFERLRAAGCEIGLHGIKHDGKLFQSRGRFEAELPKIHHYLEQWGAAGFRSPATHRRAEWMHELGCLYDSSFPDSDPFEPQAGGCCSIFPFTFGDLVELPITLVQDHTLWEILERSSIDLWRQKSEWIISNHGLINLITHPDYFVNPDRFAMYDAFLEFLADQIGCWRALAHDVASWWLARTQMRCELGSGGVQIIGDSTAHATLMWVRSVDGQIVFDI